MLKPECDSSQKQCQWCSNFLDKYHLRSSVFEADIKELTVLLKRCPGSWDGPADHSSVWWIYLRAPVRHGGARTLVCGSQSTEPRTRNLGNLVCFASCSGWRTSSGLAGGHPDVDSTDAEFSEWKPPYPVMEPPPAPTPSFLREPHSRMVLSVLISSCFHPLFVCFSVKALLTILAEQLLAKGD